MSVTQFDPKASVESPLVTLTEKAKAHFLRQLAQSDAKNVRLSIEESGCSGYMYRVALVDNSEADDAVIDTGEDFQLFVSAEAQKIVRGTQIDFKRDGLNEVVTFNNPNVTGECGCGESFVVESA